VIEAKNNAKIYKLVIIGISIGFILLVVGWLIIAQMLATSVLK
jgi:hypothetical protein